MLTKKISETCHEIAIYDSIYLHDDYVVGHVRRNPNADEESDLRHWLFYPCGMVKPISCGSLKKLFEFISDLNITQ